MGWLQDKRSELIALGAIAGVGLVAYGLYDLTTDSPAEVAAQLQEEAESAERLSQITLEPDTILYTVSGTATSADITYTTPTGIRQQQGIDVPLMTEGGTPYLEFTFDAGDFVSITAQNSGEDGEVTCQITLSTGRVLSENTSSGAFAIASCDGEAP